ncbi:uncharacterized protein LOC141864465 [Acropora palmata]|uniref:uncharacterized protein LOC141864465 n=1 Tax=Acropora palmata TaxID=6131 RepID=UPI003DA0860D
MDGSVVIGCQNTPAKGTRYCEIRKDVLKEYVNDEIGVGNIASKSDESTGLLIVKVLNEKCTQQEKMFEVLLARIKPLPDTAVICSVNCFYLLTDDTCKSFLLPGAFNKNIFQFLKTWFFWYYCCPELAPFCSGYPCS